MNEEGLFDCFSLTKEKAKILLYYTWLVPVVR